MAVHKLFPNAVIGPVIKFSKGLTSSVYKVEIHNPNKTLAIKFFPKKIEAKIEKSARISNYVSKNGLPSPKIHDIVKDDDGGWAVMDCLPGNVASEAWETASIENRYKILTSSGITLKRIHDLKIQPFWAHGKHEVISQKEWVNWTKIRIEKYLAAAQENINKELVNFLIIKFKRLQDLYDTYPDFRFVPLHWDYHFSNINVDENFEISGIFDFDNSMKGHDMADIGQTVYWLMIDQKVKASNMEIFEKFFIGYGKLSQIDREFVQLHSLLFLAGVMRSTWQKENLRWLNDLHVEVLNRWVKGEYLFI